MKQIKNQTLRILIWTIPGIILVCIGSYSLYLTDPENDRILPGTILAIFILEFMAITLGSLLKNENDD